jgi:hypothetical protein
MSTITEPAIGARRVPLLGLLLVAVIWFAGMGVAAMAVRRTLLWGSDHQRH